MIIQLECPQCLARIQLDTGENVCLCDLCHARRSICLCGECKIERCETVCDRNLVTLPWDLRLTNWIIDQCMNWIARRTEE